ncbi:hypothetical protein NKG05_01520 [Oerskovia sp. M15]
MQRQHWRAPPTRRTLEVTTREGAGTMTSPTTQTNDIKAKHRAMWALGDYPAVASEVIPDLGPVLVEACGVRTGQRVLDVGAGSGNAAIPAALRVPTSSRPT